MLSSKRREMQNIFEVSVKKKKKEERNEGEKKKRKGGKSTAQVAELTYFPFC